MPAEFPYMPSATNIAAILDRIRSAGTPPKFTHDFLKSSLGFASSNDRAMLKILKSLGFISADGTPTQRYNDYKGAQEGKALAAGLREGWADLFLSDQTANLKSTSELQSIVKSVSGAGDSIAQKVATTFKTLSEKADWTGQAAPAPGPETNGPIDEPQVEDSTIDPGAIPGLLRLHHDIHIHLPPTSEVSVYRAIFQALKAELM